MRELIRKFLSGSSVNQGSEPLEMPTAPSAGQVYSFRTKPYSEFAPPETGRFAAFKIIGTSDKLVAVAVLDGIWTNPPSLVDVLGASVIVEHRFAWRGKKATFGVNAEWWHPDQDLQDLVYLGVGKITADERSEAATILGFGVGSRFATINSANHAAEGEWRWKNDHEAFVEEQKLKQAKNDAERAAKEERYRNRLSKLTWDQLLSETPFSNWSPSPPYPPEDFTKAARKVIHDACVALRELGPKPRKPAVRAILKNTVNWFNGADKAAGGVIETEEREDIYGCLEEMAFVARQKSLVEEVDQWREW